MEIRLRLKVIFVSYKPPIRPWEFSGNDFKKKFRESLDEHPLSDIDWLLVTFGLLTYKSEEERGYMIKPVKSENVWDVSKIIETDHKEDEFYFSFTCNIEKDFFNIFEEHLKAKLNPPDDSPEAQVTI